HEEGDSPRGRIAIIQALAENSLAPTPATLRHLDGCLTCRACEAVCPADVPYGRLIDGARADLAAHGKPSRFTRLIARAARHPETITSLAPLLRPARRLPLPRRLARLRPYLNALRRLPRLARGPVEGEPVALFLGCIARALDTEALGASANLLAAAGYRVETPRGQTCCGALALHAGDRETAKRLAARNRIVFADRSTIAATATGCTAQLAEYGELLENGEEFAHRVVDVTELLARALETGRLPRSGSERTRVALHTPCTQRNVLRSDASRRCLAALAIVDVVELPPGCCGAAGSYFLDRPRDSETLRTPLLGVIRDARADCVVTANVGCRLHIAAGLAGDTSAPEVLHIASFLARRLLPEDKIRL
ncbi:MAG: (Fe-S)-binding protein, partial [Acetobacteraceae bacterium]